MDQINAYRNKLLEKRNDEIPQFSPSAPDIPSKAPSAPSRCLLSLVSIDGGPHKPTWNLIKMNAEKLEIDDYSHEHFRYKSKNFPGSNFELQYSPCSIIEDVDSSGKVHSEFRVFHYDQTQPDTELPEESYIMELKNLNKGVEKFSNGKKAFRGPKMLFCITMYQESWAQILQSIAGCCRAIFELEAEDPEEYAADNFGIVLMADGISKLPKEFVDKMIEYNLFDVGMCHNTVAQYKNKQHIPKTFEKIDAKIITDRELRKLEQEARAQDADREEEKQGDYYGPKIYSYPSRNI